MRKLTLLCIASAACLFLTGAATAAEANRAVTLPAELFRTLVDYLFVGLSALLGWAIKRGADYLHVRRESLLVDRLEQGMTYALMYAREKALEQNRDLTLFTARSDLVAMAAAYLLPKMPAVLEQLKIDPEGLKERLTGRVDLVAPLNLPEAPPTAVLARG